MTSSCMDRDIHALIGKNSNIAEDKSTHWHRVGAGFTKNPYAQKYAQKLVYVELEQCILYNWYPCK